MIANDKAQRPPLRGEVERERRARIAASAPGGEAQRQFAAAGLLGGVVCIVITDGLKERLQGVCSVGRPRPDLAEQESFSIKRHISLARPGQLSEIVDDEDGPARDARMRPISAEEAFTPQELALFARGDGLDHFVVDSELLDEVGVQDPDLAACDRAHRQLFVSRDSKLAHDEDVERGPEPLGDLEGDRHPASGEREHQDVWTAGQPLEPLGQHPSGLEPVSVGALHWRNVPTRRAYAHRGDLVPTWVAQLARRFSLAHPPAMPHRCGARQGNAGWRERKRTYLQP